jgi:hypothetical protein
LLFHDLLAVMLLAAFLATAGVSAVVYIPSVNCCFQHFILFPSSLLLLASLLLLTSLQLLESTLMSAFLMLLTPPAVTSTPTDVDANDVPVFSAACVASLLLMFLLLLASL